MSMATSPSELNLHRLKISPVCNNCRDRHLKCSGGEVCNRCKKDGILCLFRPSRRGLQGTPAVPPIDIIPKPAQPAAGTCSACRERHVKCSGVNPCSWCVRKGVPCTFRESRRGQGKHLSQSTRDRFVQYIFSVRDTSRPLLQTEKFADTKAWRGYLYFRENTQVDLNSCPEYSFWTGLLLQIGRTQPAIKHLLIALGSLHESMSMAYSTPQDENVKQLRLYALREQQAGIVGLKHSSALTCMNVLISSILLMCFDALQRDFISMAKTLRVTLKVLKNMDGASRTDKELLPDEIMPAFDACCRQAASFIEYCLPKQAPTGRFPRYISSAPAKTVEVASNFADLVQASSCLDSIIELSMTLPDPAVRQPDYPSSLIDRECCQTLLQQWHAALDASAISTQDELQREIILLQLKYHKSFIMTAPALDQGELRYDSYIFNFKSIISLAADWLRLDLLMPRIQNPSECICESICNTIIIQSLMLTATHCRDPQLRRSAVQLLESDDNWHEPMWVREAAAEIAHRVIAIEEENLSCPESCSDIPQIQRIRLLRVSRPVLDPSRGCAPPRPDPLYIDQPRQLILQYAKAPCDATSELEEKVMDLRHLKNSWPSCLMGQFASGRSSVFDKSLRLNPRPCAFQRVATTWSYSMQTAAR
jgi:hypothetical protein